MNFRFFAFVPLILSLLLPVIAGAQNAISLELDDPKPLPGASYAVSFEA